MSNVFVLPLARAQEWITVIPVETSQSIQCPFCGQTVHLALDTTLASQQFTTDCEVCCRPLAVTVECEFGEILSLDVIPG